MRACLDGAVRVEVLRISGLCSVVSSLLALAAGCQLLVSFEASDCATSCADIFAREPEARDGDYTIIVDGEGREVFCDMANGGWTQVTRFTAEHVFADADCPGDWAFEEIDSSKVVCENPAELVDRCAQASAFFESPLEEYDEVRGFVRAYQWASTDGFDQQADNVDECYVEGISFTYGSEPRQHIWTLAAGLTSAPGGSSCPCLGAAHAPRILGDSYYCDTGNTSTEARYGEWFTDDPLWVGGDTADCETLGDPAWFEARLDAPTNEPIEVRLMQGGGPDENIGVYEMELYVR